VRTANVAGFKARISEYLERLREGPVMITRHGRPTALVVNVPEDPDDIQSLVLSLSPKFWAIIDASRKTKRVPLAEVQRRPTKGRRRRRKA
jgi:prevent-host-death family protein